jgi:hypothetical protein
MIRLGKFKLFIRFVEVTKIKYQWH